jgi:hypothetical protein
MCVIILPQVGDVSGSPSLVSGSPSQPVETDQQQQSLTIPLDQARPPVKKPDIPRQDKPQLFSKQISVVFCITWFMSAKFETE